MLSRIKAARREFARFDMRLYNAAAKKYEQQVQNFKTGFKFLHFLLLLFGCHETYLVFEPLAERFFFYRE